MSINNNIFTSVSDRIGSLLDMCSNSDTADPISFADALRANCENNISSAHDSDETSSTVSDMNHGENGTLQYTVKGVDDYRLALWNALVRGVPQERIETLINENMKEYDCISNSDEEKSRLYLQDLFLILFEKLFLILNKYFWCEGACAASTIHCEDSLHANFLLCFATDELLLINHCLY